MNFLRYELLLSFQVFIIIKNKMRLLIKQKKPSIVNLKQFKVILDPQVVFIFCKTFTFKIETLV